MAMDLRQRRRLQTARDIQLAAVTLALEHGLDCTTTDAIAKEAAVSTRTFFNYYPNKEAAILGEAMKIDVAGADWFINSKAPLVEDLGLLLGRLYQVAPVERGLLTKILEVVQKNPALRDMFHVRGKATADVLADILTARLGPDSLIEARLLSDLAVRALTEAILIWARDTEMRLDDLSAMVTENLRRVAAVMDRAD
ncbi:TetR/AcrR family transcriptional regulator [Sulfitobacter maritimus]|uniref:TetR/AcrR family transcriptional regulator n=1 Tax=Sulfitobacter maritimus TaxID=2741719 RepID=UPI001582BD28|nr:TetR/AcrR family transcriptional regulator [Sulfitobacter maritimus]